jgi:hypothetical protein
MRRLISTIYLLLAGSAAIGQSLSYDILVDDGINPAINGTGLLDLSTPPEADGSVWLDGSASLGGAPPAQSLWVLDLLLGSSWWRWAAPDAPPHAVKNVTGGYGVDFGAAGIITINYVLDVENSLGSISMFLQGLNWNLLPQPNAAFWTEIAQGSSADAQGNVSGTGCILVNGKEIATFIEQATISPFADLSQLPAVEVRFGVKFELPGDPAQSLRAGHARLSLAKRFSVAIAGDFGNGAVNLADGNFDIIADARVRRWSLDGQIASLNAQADDLLSLLNLGWPAITGRAFRSPHVWANEPSVLQGTQQIDMGLLGDLGLTLLLDCSQGTAQFLYDFTAFDVQGFGGPSGNYLLHQDESTGGTGGGLLDGDGDVKSQGVPFANITGNYQLLPDPGTANLPAVQTSLELDNSLVGVQLKTLFFSANAVSEIEHSMSLTGIMDLDGSFLSMNGFLVATPVEGMNGTSRYDIVGQVQFSAPLPARGLVLAQLPGITNWMRNHAGVNEYPTEDVRFNYSDIKVYYQEGGNGSTDVDTNYDINQVSISSILENLDLGLLPILPPKAWIGIDEYGSDGEESTTDEDGCITICEVDPNTNEVVCIADCEVRYAGNTESLPKGGDITFDLLGSFLFCLQFSPDDTTVDILATFTMGKTPEVTQVPDPLSRIALRGAVPNPAPGATSVQLLLPTTQEARIGVYDLRGRQVQTLFEGSLPRGSHDFRWDGRDARGQRVAASSYFLRAIVAGRSFQQKVVLLR